MVFPMPEPVSIAGAVLSDVNATLKIAQQAAHFVEVPNEVRQLQINVKVADSSINTAHRLIRLKGHYLDHDLLNDVDRSIGDTETILKTLRETVEACRKDLETKQTVGFKNRISWVVFNNYEFLSKLATLTNALNALNRDINRLETARLPELLSLPPSYTEHIHRAVGDTATAPSFPRSPTMRRRLQRERSQRSLHSISADGRDGLGVRLDSGQLLRPSISTVSLASSLTAVEGRSETPSEETLMHVMSAPVASFDLSGGVSLGYVWTAEQPRNDCVVEDWEREAADTFHASSMIPPPVPPETLPKPKAPRRRSNLI